MSRRPRDPHTLDIFQDYAPKPVVERFNEDEVRAGRLSARMSRAVKKTLDDSGMSRPELAKAMGEFLGEVVPKSMLDAYASQAHEDHNISAVRLVALASVTSDARLLNALLECIGLIAVPARYESLIRREMAREAVERAERAAQAADAEWRARR
ncbi:hypothetical protein [Kaistia sp. MMO-174]|uniref:hypothetical protein n=1 Tax=Kaistia sp. MMO-174 TaxID=3081256 RepID=UPI00301782A8